MWARLKARLRSRRGANAWAAAASTHLAAGRSEAACAALEQALSLDPHHPFARRLWEALATPEDPTLMPSPTPLPPLVKTVVELVSALGARRTDVREDALAALARHPQPAAAPGIAGCLAAADARTRRLAVAALARLGAHALPHLLPLLADERPKVRAAARTVLGRMTRRGADRFAVTELLVSSDGLGAWPAPAADVPQPGTRVLVGLLEAEDLVVKLASVRALCAMGASEAYQPILAVAANDERLAPAAIMAWEVLGGPGDLWRLVLARPSWTPEVWGRFFDAVWRRVERDGPLAPDEWRVVGPYVRPYAHTHDAAFGLWLMHAGSPLPQDRRVS